MKRVFKNLFVIMLAIVMLAVMVPSEAFTASAVVPQASCTTGDIITFGSYPQTKVTDPSLISALNAQTLQADNTVTYGGWKYKRAYFTQYTPAYTTYTPDAANSYQDDNGYFINTVYWFKYEPIEWRVLSNTNGELFVMAEKILDSQAYNQVYKSVTWETCDLRFWLNNIFYNTAFNSLERVKIKTSIVENTINPVYNTEAGNNTNDKLFLLSCDEAMNTSYGFNYSTSSTDAARKAKGSDYAKSNGLQVDYSNMNPGNSFWLLRSPGFYTRWASHVSTDGQLYAFGDMVYDTFIGTRPAFKINLKSDIVSSKIGKNCVVDYINSFVYGMEFGQTSLSDEVNVAAGYELEYIPTARGFGTGTTVNVVLAGETVESYFIVIFGDVNGDGNIDSSDAGIIVDYENFLMEWTPFDDAANLKASDVNGDGNIDSMDSGIIVDCENFMLTIDQTTGLAS